jgi:hypothetical protein
LVERLRTALTEIEALLRRAEGRIDGASWATAEEVAVEGIRRIIAVALAGPGPIVASDSILTQSDGAEVGGGRGAKTVNSGRVI